MKTECEIWDRKSEEPGLRSQERMMAVKLLEFPSPVSDRRRLPPIHMSETKDYYLVKTREFSEEPQLKSSHVLNQRSSLPNCRDKGTFLDNGPGLV